MAEKVDKIAIDTNCLVYLLDADSQHNSSLKSLFRACFSKKIELCAAMQIIPEAVNTLVRDFHLEAAHATAIVENFIDRLNVTILYPRTGTVSLFYEYSTQISLKNRTYDILLAATIVDRGVNMLCTLNVKDFKNLPYLTVGTPVDIIRSISN